MVVSLSIPAEDAGNPRKARQVASACLTGLSPFSARPAPFADRGEVSDRE
jgi:hypothetical protein